MGRDKLKVPYLSANVYKFKAGKAYFVLCSCSSLAMSMSVSMARYL